MKALQLAAAIIVLFGLASALGPLWGLVFLGVLMGYILFAPRTPKSNDPFGP